MKYAHRLRDDAMIRCKSIIEEGLESREVTCATAEKEDRYCALADAISDLRHYADEYDLDFDCAVVTSESVFATEIEDIQEKEWQDADAIDALNPSNNH